MLAIKLMLTVIAILIGLVFVMGVIFSAVEEKSKMTKVAYWIAVAWLAIGEAFYIRYFIELLEAR